jgi:hypothetical protein
MGVPLALKIFTTIGPFPALALINAGADVSSTVASMMYLPDVTVSPVIVQRYWFVDQTQLMFPLL